MAEDLEKQLEILKDDLDKLEAKFLSQYFPAHPEDEAKAYNHDVKAYCVLSHAVFEEFIENLSSSMVNKIQNDLLEKKITLSTACFLMYWESKISIDEKSKTDCFSLVRNAISTAKQRHSALINDNHGFSKKYMQSLLMSVGLNLPNELAMDSVTKLADARGAFAHKRVDGAEYEMKYQKATRVMSPDDAKTIVFDCYVACKDMVERVAKIW
ncbi:HEPN domain-containing protein [Agrobacterium pusense]|uniref:HEPN domain-containing protein n=1 Tax=Agrobacterium pusense TaxID=648995 RepID=UPI0021D1FD6C|nr:HEPN domain-containing protein [Agrobacterium pusense]UXT89760.1 hypothetical protein FY130_08440 [Agrobacterium pusense]